MDQLSCSWLKARWALRALLLVATVSTYVSSAYGWVPHSIRGPDGAGKLTTDEPIHTLDESTDDLTAELRSNATLQDSLSQNNLFVGQDYVLKMMEERLLLDRETGKQNRFYLSGSVGVGKTQTAIQFALTHAENYTNVVFINAENEATTCRSLVEQVESRLSMKCGNSDKAVADLGLSSYVTWYDQQVVFSERSCAVARKILDWYAQFEDERRLLIYDGYDDPSTFDIEEYIPKSRRENIIITSRRYDFEMNQWNGLWLGEMRNSNAPTLFRRRLISGNEAIVWDEDIALLADQITSLVDCVPLALVQAASAISQETYYAPEQSLKTTMQQYILEYEGGLQQYWEQEPLEEWQDGYDTLPVAYQITYNSLAKRAPDAANLFMLATYFDQREIPQSLLELQHYSRAISKPNANLKNERNNIHKMIRTLQRYSMITLDFDHRPKWHRYPSTESQLIFSPHKAIRAWYKKRQPKWMQQQLTQKALEVLHAAICQEAWPSEIYWPHLEAVLNNVEKYLWPPSHTANECSDIHLSFRKAHGLQAKAFRVFRNIYTQFLTKSPSSPVRRSEHRYVNFTRTSRQLLYEIGFQMEISAERNRVLLLAFQNECNELGHNRPKVLESAINLTKTRFFAAVQDGDITMVKLIMDAGVIDLDFRGFHNRTPLLLAAQGGHTDIVKLLLGTQKIDINSASDGKETPLAAACRYGFSTIADLLLATGKADLTWRDPTNHTLLSLAIDGGHETIVKRLLQFENIDVNHRLTYGETSLIKASRNGHEAIAKLLLNSGRVDIDSRDEYNTSAFGHAVAGGHTGIVRTLLRTNEVDVNSSYATFRTPFMQAAWMGHMDVIKLLVESRAIDVGLGGHHNHTALMLAAWQGHADIVNVLLATGRFDVNAKDVLNQTALFLAAGRGHTDVVESLIGAGNIDLNAQDRYNRTSLSLAAGGGHLAMVRLLLEMDGVDVNIEDIQGLTPLMNACHKGYEAIVKLLLGVDELDVNFMNVRGETAFWHAITQGKGSVVTMLLDSGRLNFEKKPVPHSMTGKAEL